MYNHNCNLYLTKTENTYIDKNNIKQTVFICDNCKRYYIKLFSALLLEVKFDYYKQEWFENGNFKKIKE